MNISHIMGFTPNHEHTMNQALLKYHIDSYQETSTKFRKLIKT